MMERIRIPRIMQETSKRILLKSKSIGFVPTMGALHEGHMSLIKRARTENDVVVASIFVNPLQFGANEDLQSYPRTLERDIEKLEEAQTDILFLPEEQAIYPEGFCTYVSVEGLSERLCGAFRKGHFTGVTTVVCKLLNLVKPTRLYLGQKDYQQMQIIKKMTEHLNMDIDIVGCRTIRESDGLAMSSRNSYLTPKERQAATVIYRTLSALSELIVKEAIPCIEVPALMQKLISEEPLVDHIQYAGIYDAESLTPLKEYKKINLLAVALKLGQTRLIDNMLVELKC